MIKTGLFFIVILFLMAILVMSPFLAPPAFASVPVKHRLVILDLPGLDLKKLSTDYPNLEQLVSTGSTGLVRIPLTSATYSGSFIQSAITQVLSKGSVNTIINEKTYRSLPKQWEAAVMIHGDDFIDFEGAAPKTSGNNVAFTNNSITGVDRLLEYYRLYRDRTGIILFTFGKSHRASPESSAQARYFHQKMGSIYDDLVARISAEINYSNTLFMVYSSSPPKQLIFKNTSLTPVVLKGMNFSKGILYAPSTRKEGILTLNDLRGMIGGILDPKTQTVVSVKNIPGEWRTIAYYQHALLKNYVLRWPILTFYCYLLLGVIFLFIGGIVLGWRRVYLNILAWSFLYLLTIPAAFLLEALFDPLDWISITFWTFLISGILFLFSYFVSGKELTKTLLFISLLTVGVVGIDGLLNGYYEHKSFLGYSVVAGARYYGIGNEYMGILLGSYIVGVGLILQRLKKWRREVVWSVTVIISLILIHPYFGADVGGGITALMGLGITNFLWLKQPIRLGRLARLSLFTLGVFILMGALDLYVYQSSMSHLGKLLLSVQKNGIGVFIALVIRKITLNIRLINSTPLALILIGVLVTIPFLYQFPPRPIKGFVEKYPEAISGLVGLSITAFIGLLTNDSGIVSAAMTFLFGCGLIITLIVREQHTCFYEQ